MIVDEGKYYLYRHIRLDKNEVFYVGIGTKQKIRYNTEKDRYRRAYLKHRRSNFWRGLSKNGYRVEIMLESDDSEFIKEKEIEFIKLYGRRELGLGSLCNLTNGGEGTFGRIISEKERLNHDYVSITGKNHYLAKVVYKYDKNGEYINKYDTLSECSKKHNVIPGTIKAALKSRTLHKENYYSYKLYSNFIQEGNPKTSFFAWPEWRTNNLPVCSKPIVGYHLDGTIFKEFPNTVEALKYLNINTKLRGKNHITRTALGHRKQGYGYIWKYKEN